jgi:hypothetical protein
LSRLVWGRICLRYGQTILGPQNWPYLNHNKGGWTGLTTCPQWCLHSESKILSTRTFLMVERSVEG